MPSQDLYSHSFQSTFIFHFSMTVNIFSALERSTNVCDALFFIVCSNVSIIATVMGRRAYHLMYDDIKKMYEVQKSRLLRTALTIEITCVFFGTGGGECHGYHLEYDTGRRSRYPTLATYK